MVDTLETNVEDKCVSMLREGCCLAESARVPFSAGARIYQTWKCPQERLRQRRSAGAFHNQEGERTELVHEFVAEQVPWNVDRVDTRPSLLDGSYLPLEITPGTGAVHVYIVDTGIFQGHEGFASVDVSMDYPSPAGAQDCNGHGTHVASIVASRQTGVVPETGRVVLHAVRVLDCTGGGTTTSVVMGLSWIVNNLQRPAIINLSLGGPRSAILDNFIDTMRSDFGVLSVSAAGNENVDACTRSPAGAIGTVAVGATRYGDSRASYSNYGGCVNIFAPGSDVLGAGIDSASDYDTRSGTSMAAPHVAGALARLALTSPGAAAKINAGVWDALLSRATADIVQNAGPGSPNVFLFVGDDARPPPTRTIPPPPALISSSGRLVPMNCSELAMATCSYLFLVYGLKIL